MNAATGAGLGLALTSTTLTNLGYLREHDAAAALPCLSIRRPLHSVTLLLTSRRWALGFAMEASGFLLYATALALAPLKLVQSIAAGGVGVLGVVSARTTDRRLSRRERTGVVMAVLGLLSLAVSLAGGSAHGRGGSTPQSSSGSGPSPCLRSCSLGRTQGASGSRGARHRRRALLLDRRRVDEGRDHQRSR